MFCQWTVADLAMEASMFSQLFLIDDVSVTVFTYFMTGVGDGAGRQFGDGSSAIVPVLTKGFRDHRGTKHNESDECHEHDRREPDEMFYVLEQKFPLAPGSGRWPSCAQEAQ